MRSWPLPDLIAYGICWITGVLLCLIAGGIVLFMLSKGLSYLQPALLVEHPEATLDQSKSGGFLDPIEGTLLLTTIGTLIAAPIGISVASWLS